VAKVRIIGERLPNIPWQERTAGCTDVVWRHRENPIIGWNPTRKTARVFNSAVIPWRDGFVGVFRADHKDGKAQLHTGWSKDGLAWEIEDEEIHWKDAKGNPYETFYAYDPRLVKIEDACYVIWCTEFGGGPTLGLGTTKDFRSYTRLENACVPCNRNGVLFPRRINGNFLLLNRPSDTGHTPFGDIFVSESPDLTFWGRHRKVMSRGGSGWWQGTKIGAGPIPIETTEGWLLFYHGVVTTCNGYVYSMGAAILDAACPSKVLYRTRDYLLTPEKDYETNGFVPNVAFPCATLQDAESGRIAIYYGAADTYVAVAYTRVEELVDYIKASSELVTGDDREWR
jgi:beta-1,4-mannooligosaccharide/beta-1,4-mannosyl-N-acetylglucosamine phosphorylase